MRPAAQTPGPNVAGATIWHLSDLIGRSICTESGERIAQVRDLVIRVRSGGYPPVSGVVTRSNWKSFFIPWSHVESLDQTGFHLHTAQVDLHTFSRRDGEMLLQKDVLDKQVVDLKGRRVVRSNDLRLLYRPSGRQPAAGAAADGNGDRAGRGRTAPTLLLIGIDITTPALLRRLLPSAMKARVESSTVIDWRDIEQLASESPGVRLKIDHRKLGKLHPAEIANIIEDLSSNQAEELFEHLDDATAADTLEEMNPDDAADLLATLTEEKRDELLRRMDAQEAEDVRELLQYQEDDAGGLMTTDYVAVPDSMTAGEVIDHIRSLEDVPDVIHYIYAVDDLETETLLGMTDLQAVLRANPEARVREFMRRDLQTVPPEEDAEETAKIMSEYNLLALPVVGPDGKLLGIVTVDDAMELLLPDQFRRQVPRVFS